MIFHENCLLADNSYVISYLTFRKLGKMSQKLSAAVVIGALRLKMYPKNAKTGANQPAYLCSLINILILFLPR